MSPRGSWQNLVPQGYQLSWFTKTLCLPMLLLDKQITQIEIQSIHLKKYRHFTILGVYKFLCTKRILNEWNECCIIHWSSLLFFFSFKIFCIPFIVDEELYRWTMKMEAISTLIVDIYKVSQILLFTVGSTFYSYPCSLDSRIIFCCPIFYTLKKIISVQNCFICFVIIKMKECSCTTKLILTHSKIYIRTVNWKFWQTFITFNRKIHHIDSSKCWKEK
jgi:hypothetical protein